MLYEDQLYLASAGRLLERLQHLPERADSVLLIGHNPGLHQLALTLARHSESLNQGFPTAALAVLRIAGTWDAVAPGCAKLANYQTPKSLNRDSNSDPD